MNTRKAARICFRRWVRWLHGKPGFETATSRDLIIRRITGEDPYEFVDLKQEFIGSLVMRKASKGKFQGEETAILDQIARFCQACGRPL